MKNVLLLFFATLVHIGYSQCADPVITNFECGTPSQTLGGNGITSIANPESGGINMSANVGEYIDDGTQGWDNLLIDYGMEIDLTTNNQFSFKIYSPTSIQVLAKLEGGTAVEKWSSFSATNTWEQFTFDFSDAVGNGNTKLVLFFNAGVETGTPTDTYYVDDIQWSSTTNTLPTIADFEAINPALALPSTVRKVSNLHHGGMNTSTNIGEYTDDGTQGFDGLVIDYGTAIDLSTNNQFKLKLYSPSSIQVLAKLEGGTEQEVYSDFSDVNTWQEFTFDFSTSAGNGNTKLVLFFNPGVTSGTANDIYYIDDLRFDSASLAVDEFDFDVKVYPNPAIDHITINSKINIEKYELMNVSGKILMSEANKEMNTINVDVSTLSQGLYFLRLTSGTLTKTLKVVKQ
jgi:hypothetical protein